jgi:hypothetical protein
VPDVTRPGLSVYHAVHRHATWLADAVSTLARSLDRPVSANLYLARGGGFTRHWDEHDSVILQIAGSRRWTMEPRIGVLMRGTAAAESPPGDADTRSLVLAAGEALRIPCGWWHEARSHGPPSAHLTFALGPCGEDEWTRWIGERPARRFAPAFPWRITPSSPTGWSITWAGGAHVVESRAAQVAHRLLDGPVAPAGDASVAQGLVALTTLGLARPSDWTA